MRTRAGLIVTMVAAFPLVGCNLADNDWQYVPQDQRVSAKGLDQPSILGPGGLTLFGGSSDVPSAAGSGIGVNSFLWRASLDTISFMPLSSADPFGGVIITDWYAPPETPDERFKMTVYILDRTLRADGLRVALFRQQRDGRGDWVDSVISPNTITTLENKILERARELRTAAIGE